MCTIYSSVLADVKVGLITSIWSINSFMNAITDKVVFGLELTINQFIGMLFMIASVVLLGLFKPAAPKEQQLFDPIPLYIPIMFGVITPFIFTLAQLYMKFVVKRRGVNTSNLSFNTELFINTIILITGIVHWSKEGIQTNLLGYGIISGIFETCGKASSL